MGRFWPTIGVAARFVGLLVAVFGAASMALAVDSDCGEGAGECQVRCTRTIGYWKNHPDDWPVSSLGIGGVTYDKLDALAILATGVEGDATYILARQLIATKLNILSGADPSAIAGAVTEADAWLGDNPLGSDPGNPSRADGILLAGQLDDYNNGRSGPGHCGDGVCGDGNVDPDEECDPLSPDPCCVDCRFAPSETACPDDGNPCTDDLCNDVGQCTHPDNNASCDDGQFCTTGDVCSAGVCRGETFVPPACDDSNLCTDDACDPSAEGGAGACQHVSNSNPCDDGKYCTVDDICSGGTCMAGAPRDCGEGQTCLIAVCNESAGQCILEADPEQEGQPCSDDSACTTGTTCAAGVCGGGSALDCDDASSCTADSCDPVSGCVFEVVVETPICASCVDGTDNDGDGDVDAEDDQCATLSELQRFAVISTATSGRDPLYTGSDVAVDAIAGSIAGSPAPYPIGNSRAGVCAYDGSIRAGGNFGILATRGVIEFGNGTALDVPGDDFGNVRSIDLRTEFCSDGGGEILKTAAPLVGPGSCSDRPWISCTESEASCTAQSAGACCATADAVCSGRMRLDDPANPNVDRSGAAENYQKCVDAMDAMLADAQAIAGIPGNVAGYLAADDAEVRTGKSLASVEIDVGGGGLRVLEMVRVILAGNTTLTLTGPSDATVVIRIRRQLRLGGKARVLLAGGLKPENVLWNVEGRFGGQPNLKRSSELNGTILAPERPGIRCGGGLQVSGALFAPRIHLGANVRISHRPFLGLVQ